MTTRWKTRMIPLLLVVAVAGFALVGGQDAVAQALPGTGKKLTFAFVNWTGDWLPLMVTKVLVEEHLGYEVEVADLAVPLTYAMLAAGEVDVFPNAYYPNQNALLEAYEADLEVISWHYDNSVHGFALPTWFVQQYGVETIQDLNDPEIARLLDRDGDGLGDLMGCEVGWACNEQLEFKLQEYGLDRLYRQVDASEQMINYAVQGAMEAGEPVLFYRWTPDWLFAVYPFPETVTLLRDEVGAWPDPNEDPGVYGFPTARAGILVHRDLKRHHPEAYALMSQISVPLESVNESVYRQVVLGETSDADLERHAREWIAANRSTVDAWLEAAGL